MYKTLLGALILFLLTGCGLKTAYAPPAEYKLDETTEESNATKIILGETKTAKLDDILVAYEQATRTVHSITDTRFKALKEVVIQFPDGQSCRIEKGRSYIPSSRDASQKHFRIAIPSDDKSSLGAWVIVDREGKLVGGDATKEALSVQIASAGDQLFGADFKVLVHRQVDDIPVKLFRQELRYGGMEGENIVIEYREYTDGTKDPVSAEILQYNLSASDIIRHKQFKLGVLYVDADKIKYRVLGAPR